VDIPCEYLRCAASGIYLGGNRFQLGFGPAYQDDMVAHAGHSQCAAAADTGTTSGDNGNFLVSGILHGILLIFCGVEFCLQ